MINKCFLLNFKLKVYKKIMNKIVKCLSSVAVRSISVGHP